MNNTNQNENFDCFQSINTHDNYKEYLLHDNSKLCLPKDKKVASKVMNGIVLIKNDKLYGVAYKVGNSYQIIEPKYKRAYLNNISFWAEDDNSFYILPKRDLSPLSTYFNEYIVYDKKENSDLVKLFKLQNKNDINVFESDGNLIIQSNNNVITFNIETGQKIAERKMIQKKMVPRDDYLAHEEEAILYLDGGNIAVFDRGLERRNLVDFYNIQNNTLIKDIGYFSKFVNGYAIIQQLDWGLFIYQPFRITPKFNKYEVRGKYIVDDYCRIVTRKGYLLTYSSFMGISKGYGYRDFYENIVVKPKCHTIDEANDALDKYIEEKNKPAITDQQLLLEDKVVEEEVKTAETEIDKLENSIYKRLDLIGIDELKKSFEEKRDNYNIKINNAVEIEKEDRKNTLFNSTPILRTTDTSKNIYNNYKYELQAFLDYLENDFYIQAKYTLGRMLNIIDGQEVDVSNDELLKYVSTLYQSILELDDELETRNINRLRELINSYQVYFDSYINKTNTEVCKYTSKQSWEADFRIQLLKLIYLYQADYDNEQELHNRLNMEADFKDIENDRYKSLDLYINEIHKTIKEIEDMTKDEFYLSLIDKYRNIKADYNYNLEETTKELNEALLELYRIKRDIEFGIEPDQYKR